MKTYTVFLRSGEKVDVHADGFRYSEGQLLDSPKYLFYTGIEPGESSQFFYKDEVRGVVEKGRRGKG